MSDNNFHVYSLFSIKFNLLTFLDIIRDLEFFNDLNSLNELNELNDINNIIRLSKFEI